VLFIFANLPGEFENDKTRKVILPLDSKWKAKKMDITIEIKSGKSK